MKVYRKKGTADCVIRCKSVDVAILSGLVEWCVEHLRLISPDIDLAGEDLDDLTIRVIVLAMAEELKIGKETLV